MKDEQKDILRIRVISTFFVVLALAVFKPFGLEAWRWQAYIHLLIIFILGILVCLLTDVVMNFFIRKPRSMADINKTPNLPDINYFIRRNLYYQIINTVLESLMICLYRHYLLSDRVEGNQLSWSNFLETLLIIAFCSFAIGLYWRFKFRSKYLASELEETRMLNEQLKNMQPKPSPVVQQPETVTLTGTTNESVTLQISDLLYIEAVGNYVKVYQNKDGKVHSDLLRATSKQMENDLDNYPMIVRCHRAFLVNLEQVEQIISHSGTMQLLIKHSHETIPVSRSNMAGLKKAIKDK
ncbi:MAG: LytTR family transcriptional regulator DNA-binding domain-containing protein [Prevotella sp.]|nr:LytTR family transcriptional regulator DNA-binding domain-containing protein [Prevotella sp.]